MTTVGQHQKLDLDIVYRTIYSSIVGIPNHTINIANKQGGIRCHADGTQAGSVRLGKVETLIGKAMSVGWRISCL